MRKIFAIIAFCCLVLLNAGYYVLYQLRLFEIKEGMKKEVLHSRRNELTQFNFSSKKAANLVWEEKNEFRYEEEMYDVVEMETSGDSVIIYCLADKKEKELKEEYARSHKLPGGTSHSASIFEILKAPFLPSSTTLASLEAIPGSKNIGFNIDRLSCSDHKVLLPPPKSC